MAPPKLRIQIPSSFFFRSYTTLVVSIGRLAAFYVILAPVELKRHKKQSNDQWRLLLPTQIHTHNESDKCIRVQFLSLLSPLRSYIIKKKDFANTEIRTINLRVSRRILTPGTMVPQWKAGP